jgi:hypothetical protein
VTCHDLSAYTYRSLSPIFEGRKRRGREGDGGRKREGVENGEERGRKGGGLGRGKDREIKKSLY